MSAIRRDLNVERNSVFSEICVRRKSRSVRVGSCRWWAEVMPRASPFPAAGYKLCRHGEVDPGTKGVSRMVLRPRLYYSASSYVQALAAQSSIRILTTERHNELGDSLARWRDVHYPVH